MVQVLYFLTGYRKRIKTVTLKVSFRTYIHLVALIVIRGNLKLFAVKEEALQLLFEWLLNGWERDS